MEPSETEAPLANKSPRANIIHHHTSSRRRRRTLENENYNQQASITELDKERISISPGCRRSLSSSISSSHFRHSPTTTTSGSAWATTANNTPESTSATLAVGVGVDLASNPTTASTITTANKGNSSSQTNNPSANKTTTNLLASPTTSSLEPTSTFSTSVPTNIDGLDSYTASEGGKMSRQPTPGYSCSGGDLPSAVKYTLCPPTSSLPSSSMGLYRPPEAAMRYPHQQPLQQQPHQVMLHTGGTGLMGSGGGPGDSVSGEDVPTCMGVGDWRMRPAVPLSNVERLSFSFPRPSRVASMVGRGGFDGSEAVSVPFAMNPVSSMIGGGSGMSLVGSDTVLRQTFQQPGSGGLFPSRNFRDSLGGGDFYGVGHPDRPGSLLPPHVTSSSAANTVTPGGIGNGRGTTSMTRPSAETLLEMSFAYCFNRGNGQYTRLIPADMLPDLKDIPKLQDNKAGMIVLRPPQAAPPRGVNSNTEPVSLLHAADPVQAHIDHIIRGAPAATTRRPKIYCDKWVHEGVCAFTQQGCKYKHEMPFDRTTQHALGLFHGLPQWWKKHQAELQRSNNKELVDSAEQMPDSPAEIQHQGQKEQREQMEKEEQQQRWDSRASSMSPGTGTATRRARGMTYESTHPGQVLNIRNSGQVLHGQKLEGHGSRDMIPSPRSMSRIISPPPIEDRNTMQPDRKPDMLDPRQQKIPGDLWIDQSENRQGEDMPLARDLNMMAPQLKSRVVPSPTTGFGSRNTIPINTPSLSAPYTQIHTGDGRGQKSSHPLSVIPAFRQGQGGAGSPVSASTQRGYGPSYPDNMTPATPATPVSPWGPIGPPARREDVTENRIGGVGQQQQQHERKLGTERHRRSHYGSVGRRPGVREGFNSFSLLSLEEGEDRST